MLQALALAAALSPAMAWRQVGPAAAGGRVAAVAGTDRDSLLYYFGAAGGGVFKTTNGGLTWNDVWPSSSVGAIGAVAIAPSNKNVVWAGTGESAPRNDASFGDGVWRTVNGGKRWTWLGLPRSYAISRIIVNPHDPDVALVGVLGNPFVDSTERGVYRTTDGGRTWQKLHGNGLPSGLMGRIGVAVAPSDPKRVYALIQSKAGLLWRSDDAGKHWRLMSRDTLIDQRPFYMSRLIVDPANRDHVFFASENLIETRDGGKTFVDIHDAVHQDHHDFWISGDGRRLIEADDGGAPISVDGGKTWDWRFNVVLAQTYHIGYDEQNPYHVCGAFQDNDSFCGPSNSLSQLGITSRDWRDVANDSDGVWVWPQPGEPASVWNVGVNETNGQLGIFELESRQNYDITPSVSDTNGWALASLPYRFNWEAPLAFSNQLDGVAYFGANVVFETSNRGRTWKPISPDLTRNDPAKQQVAGGPVNTDVSGAEFYDTLLDIAPSPIDGKVIWIGTDDGVLQRTIDGGSHWMNVTPPVLPWGRVETIEPSHVSVDRAYAVVNRNLLGDRTPYIFATDDGGRSWRRINSGLPREENAHVVREDPVNPDVLYAGLERGAWISFDRGERWESLRLGMPAVAIHDLRVQPLAHDLIAGTHGRGLWILDDLTPIERLRDAQTKQAPVLFPIRSAYTWYIWWLEYGTHDDECCVPSGAYSGTNPPNGATFTYFLPERSVTPVRVEVLDADGRIVRRMSGTRAAGLNRVTWDLGSAPPVQWKRARQWNQGGSSGPTVVPGAYTIRLLVGSTILSQPLTVLPDPRAHWSQADYIARYQFLSGLNDELSAVDDALNRLDAMRTTVTPQHRRALDRVYAQFTSGIVNSEDSLWMADRLRERITILQGDVALSQGPPLPPHVREAQAIHNEYEQAMAAYDGFLTANGISASEDHQ